MSQLVDDLLARIAEEKRNASPDNKIVLRMSRQTFSDLPNTRKPNLFLNYCVTFDDACSRNAIYVEHK